MTGTPDLTVGLLAGFLTASFLMVAIFFLRFFVKTREFLFIAFSAAFSLLAANSAVPILLRIPREEQAPVYLLRLAAFLLIIVAVLLKNLPRAR